MIYNTFVQDLNEKNPLGTGGKLACNYADLLKELYESSSSSVAPWGVKKVIGQHAPQFNGFS
jgi:ubiquitin C-terminal hydrolase